jgi:hypothetical protein
MKDAPQTRDYFAEMYVAGILADNGWNIYFPRRDKGFDFIITKAVDGRIIVRPVQVKGKYPEEGKTDKTVYGYIGGLTELHDDMVLVITFFSADPQTKSPECVAYVPRSRISDQASKGYKCQPAKFIDGEVKPRKDFKRYFDREGIQKIESQQWR